MLAFVNNDPVYKDKCLQENMTVFHLHNFEFIKGGFFSESAIRFSNLQNINIPKNYPELEI